MTDTGNNCKVRFHQVVQRFRMIYDRPATVRQAFARFFRGPTQVQIFEALKGVSFTVNAGETLGILGRNGSGKSTILKIIARVYRPTSGTVEIDGRVSPLIELGAGFHPELTGRENIVLSGCLMGIDREQMVRRTDAIVAFSELEEFIDVPVKQYSSGMYARLGFAVATEIDPDILLVDEILAVGDAGFQHKCLERMNNFRRQGKTIVFVSHDLNTITSLCTRALLLDHGRLLAQGPTEEVAAQYQKLLEGTPANLELFSGLAPSRAPRALRLAGGYGESLRLGFDAGLWIEDRYLGGAGRAHMPRGNYNLQLCAADKLRRQLLPIPAHHGAGKKLPPPHRQGEFRAAGHNHPGLQRFRFRRCRRRAPRHGQHRKRRPDDCALGCRGFARHCRRPHRRRGRARR